ncbi:ribosomal protein S10 [Neorickettsia helminthoeca str. Oregon]|uniref:Small ribosomal subunit protein uS10 n=1 Tax=Neorickettsia helminthoeca str. Oregon TaxID=1286528 RepID=X5HJF4_9RICK|nr:ribosomal protein S10 [Neorickettsia helminthoeca str. Oregon]
MKKIRIKLRSFDSGILHRSAKEIVMAAKRNGALVSGPIPLPTRMSRYTVNRSPHVDKKSREQFQLGVYKCLLELSSFNAHLLSTFTNFQLPAGVDVSVEVRDE